MRYENRMVMILVMLMKMIVVAVMMVIGGGGCWCKRCIKKGEENTKGRKDDK